MQDLPRGQQPGGLTRKEANWPTWATRPIRRTTNSFLVEAHEIVGAWGFVPKTVLTWVKVKADGSPSMKTGYYYRSATEHLLFAVRGSLRLAGPCRPTAYLLPRAPHSVKPDFFYDLIEEQSPGPYLELCARRPRPGWDQWGNQIDSIFTFEASHE